MSWPAIGNMTITPASARLLEITWETLGKFAEQHGELIPPALRRACLRRRLHRFLRWARKNAPKLIPIILSRH